jgi:hypothetical protein
MAGVLVGVAAFVIANLPATAGRAASAQTLPFPVEEFDAHDRINSRSGDVATVGDLFFLHLVRGQFARIRIQTARYSSNLVSVGAGQAWVHAVRDSTRR